MAKVSKYAEKLRELGFSEIPTEVSENVRQVLPRNKRRLIKSGKLKPTFTASGLITYVTDEFGQSWQALGDRSEDLNKLPFINHTSLVMSDLKAMRQTDKRFN